MATIDRVVRTTLTRVEGIQGLDSFDILALITNETPNSSFGTARAKRYTASSLSTIGTDWTVTSELYKAAVKVFSQRPTVNEIYAIERDAAVAIVQLITWSGDFATGETITGTVNGDAISVPWNTSQIQTMTDLNTAIAAAYGVDTSSGTANINTVTADAEHPLSITISAAGGNAPTAVISTSVAGRTIADDIQEAVDETATNKWYALYNCQAVAGQHLSAAALIETLPKIYVGQSADADVITTATDDVVSRLEDAGYTRSGIVYRSSTGDHAFAALMGRFLADSPGSISAANKQLAGVTATTLSDTEIANAEGKNCNLYDSVANQGLFKDGIMVDGNAIEAMRDLDYMVSEVNAALFALAKNNPKIPFTSPGLALVEGEGQAVIDRMVAEGVLNGGDPENDIDAPVFSVPALADISEADKTARILTGCTVRGTYAGAMIEFEVAITINLVG